VAGVLERAQMPWIRSGHRTLFLTLEDETELGQVVVFNDVYLKYGAILKDAIYLLVDGELQNDEEHGLAVVAHQVYDLLEVIGRPAAERSGAIAPHPSSPVPEHRWGDAGWMPWVEPRTRPGRTGGASATPSDSFPATRFTSDTVHSGRDRPRSLKPARGRETAIWRHHASCPVGDERCGAPFGGAGAGGARYRNQ